MAEESAARRRASTPDAGRPLKKALTVQTPDEFVAQLRKLKSAVGMSFERIAKASNDRLPKSTCHWMVQQGNFPARAEQVREFVMACGVNADDAELWCAAYSRVRVQETIYQSSPAAGKDLARYLEQVGDDLAARGHLRAAINVYKDALVHHRLAGDKRPVTAAR